MKPVLILFAYQYWHYTGLWQTKTGRSPLFTHATSTSTGIATIRACKNQEILCREYETHSDCHTQACFALICVSIWFAIYLDIVVSIYTVFIVYGCALLRGKQFKIKNAAFHLSDYGFEFDALKISLAWQQARLALLWHILSNAWVCSNGAFSWQHKWKT